MDLPRPLDGVRVLDLSRVLSGPYAGRMLADLGADVVKVEPPEGDVTRNWGEVRHGLAGFYSQQNAGKRNISVDLKAAGGPDLVARLAAVADVLIENFRPGVLARFGLGWGELSAANPRLVMLSISGFGQEGPERHRQAYAPVVHAESGLTWRNSELYGLTPTDPILSVADTNASLHGLVGVLAALHLRHTTGRGQHVDLSMLHAMLATDDYVHHVLDANLPVVRLGGQVFEAVGGPVLVSADARYLWRQLHRVHGVADPAPQDATLEDKIALRADAMTAWIRSFDDRGELIAALEAANLAWGDVRSPAEVLDNPTVRAGGVAAEVDDRGGGTRRIVDSPYRFSDAASGLRAGAPHRGEHNAEVLDEWLGLGGDAVAALAADGVLLADDGAGGDG